VAERDNILRIGTFLLFLQFVFLSSSFGMVPLEQFMTHCETQLVRKRVVGIIPKGARYIKDEQAPYLSRFFESNIAGQSRERQIERFGPYYFTGPQLPRQAQWPEWALQELKSLTDWEVPFGVSYDEKLDQTTFVALGDPNMIRGIALQVFHDAKDLSPRRTIPLKKLADMNDNLAWKVTLNGKMDGLWYRYHYETIPGLKSDMGEELPEDFFAIDPMAFWSNGTLSRIYFPPTREEGHESEKSSPQPDKPLITLELSFRDLTPGDTVSFNHGWARTPRHSRFVQSLLKPFSGIEILPVRLSNSVDIFPSTEGGDADTVYFHYWGYMPTAAAAIASDLGGPDAVIDFLRKMQLQGKAVLKDEVIQHTANKRNGSDPTLNLLHFAMRNVYRLNGCDLTGCGNTTNLDWGNPFTKLMIQLILQDFIAGWNGHRYDLMGAIPHETASALVELTLRYRKHVTGEPYGVPFDRSFWNTNHNTIRKASLWDHVYREKLREAIKEQSSIGEIVKRLRGGFLFNWAGFSQDRTAILETHDGKTLLEEFGGRFDQALYATALQLMSQGSVTLGLSQVLGIRHSHLDNTPLDLSELSTQQMNHLQNILEWVNLRKKFNAFFAHPFLDENSPNDYVAFSDLHPNFGWIWLKKAAYSDPDLQSDQQLVVVMNNSMYRQTIKVPRGRWIIQGSTHRQSDFHSIEEEITVEAYSVHLLTKF
jgi:hypothetical protein